MNVLEALTDVIIFVPTQTAPTSAHAMKDTH